MVIDKKTGILSATLLGLTLMTGTAFAGPRMTFGPEDEGVLQGTITMIQPQISIFAVTVLL